MEDIEEKTKKLEIKTVIPEEDIHLVSKAIEQNETKVKACLEDKKKLRHASVQYKCQMKLDNAEEDLYGFHEYKDSDECRFVTGTWLHKAVVQGKWACVKLLLKYEADRSEQDSRGQTPLMVAIMEGCFDENILESLVTPENINMTDLRNGYTALFFAVKKQNWQAARFLLKKGADPSKRFGSCQKDTVLTRALRFDPNYGDSYIVSFNIERTPTDIIFALINPDTAQVKGGFRSWGKTPLQLAIQHAYWEAIPKLIEAGADPNAVDSEGRTLLMEALWTEQKPIPKKYAEYLVNDFTMSKGLDEDSKEMSITLLHAARNVKKWGIMSCMVEHGADITAVNYFGHIPLNSFFEEENTQGFHFDGMPLDLLQKLVPKNVVFEHLVAAVCGVFDTREKSILPLHKEHLMYLLQRMPTPSYVNKLILCGKGNNYDYYEYSHSMTINTLAFNFSCGMISFPKNHVKLLMNMMTYLLSQTCYVRVEEPLEQMELAEEALGKKKFPKIQDCLRENYQKLETFIQNPISLTKMAMFKIRELLSSTSEKAFDSLNIPGGLVSKIKFEDVVKDLLDMLEDYMKARSTSRFYELIPGYVSQF